MVFREKNVYVDGWQISDPMRSLSRLQRNGKKECIFPHSWWSSSLYRHVLPDVTTKTKQEVERLKTRTLWVNGTNERISADEIDASKEVGQVLDILHAWPRPLSFAFHF